MIAGMTTPAIGPVDFVGIPTRDLEAAAAFYGETLGLRRSVYYPERNFAEFETDNLTLSVYTPCRWGWTTTAIRTPSRCTSTTSRRRARSSRPAAWSSWERRSTRASVTWRSSPTPTVTR